MPPNEEENYIESDDLVLFSFVPAQSCPPVSFFPPIHMHIKHFFSKDRPTFQVLGLLTSEACYHLIEALGSAD